MSVKVFGPLVITFLCLGFLLSQQSAWAATSAQSADKTPKVVFEPQVNPDQKSNQVVLKISEVPGGETYRISAITSSMSRWRDLGTGNRKCAVGWVSCHRFANVPMPRDQVATYMVRVFDSRKQQVAKSTWSFTNPTDRSVFYNLLRQSFGFKLPPQPDLRTSDGQRENIRRYYDCRRWSARLYAGYIVAQAALLDPLDLNGVWAMATEGPLPPDFVRESFESRGWGLCERSYLDPIYAEDLINQ